MNGRMGAEEGGKEAWLKSDRRGGNARLFKAKIEIFQRCGHHLLELRTSHHMFHGF